MTCTNITQTLPVIGFCEVLCNDGDFQSYKIEFAKFAEQSPCFKELIDNNDWDKNNNAIKVPLITDFVPIKSGKIARLAVKFLREGVYKNGSEASFEQFIAGTFYQIEALKIRSINDIKRQIVPEISDESFYKIFKAAIHFSDLSLQDYCFNFLWNHRSPEQIEKMFGQRRASVSLDGLLDVAKRLSEIRMEKLESLSGVLNCFSVHALDGDMVLAVTDIPNGDEEWFSIFEDTMNRFPITHLSINNPNLNEQGMEKLCKILKRNLKLTGLTFDSTRFSIEMAKKLKDIIEINNFIKNYQLIRCDIDDDLFLLLSESLINNQVIKSFNLSQNQLTTKSKDALANIISQNSQLKTFLLSNNKLGAEGAAAIANALMQPGVKLENLNLSSNEIGDEGAQNMATHFKNGITFLKFLTLNSNNIKKDGAAMLLSSLHFQPNLTELNLGWNAIDNNIVESVRELLKTNNTLRILHLNNNKLSTFGIKTIKELFETLVFSSFTLNLRGNAITDEMYKDLNETQDKLNQINPSVQILK